MKPVKRLRFWITTLCIWLIFFFNIERILFEIYPNIFRSYTYVFVALLVVTILLLPRLHPLPFSILLTAAVAAFLLFWYQQPILIKKTLWVNTSQMTTITLLTITQLSAIVITGLLARQLNYGLREFEQVIANITYSHIGQLPRHFLGEQSSMYRELTRARYYQRPLAVIALKIDEEVLEISLPRMVKEVQQAMMKEFALANIARILDSQIHDFDTIALYDNCLVVVLPEVGAEEVLPIVQRLEKMMRERINVNLQIGTANFPGDAVTFERLVELAMENSNSYTKVQPRPSQAKEYSVTQNI